MEGWFWLFPHCLILNSDEWSCAYAQTSPKGWRAGCGEALLCLKPSWLESQSLALRGRMNLHRLRGREPPVWVVRGLESEALSKVIPPPCSRQPWV